MTPLAFVVACSLGFHDFVPIRTDHEGMALPREVVGRVGSMRFRHSGAIQQLVATPDGSRCVTRTSDNVVTVWEIRTGRRLAQHFFPKHEVQAIATDDSDITMVLTDNRGWYCRRIELVSGRIVVHRKLDHEADKVAFSATGDRLVVRLGALFEVQESVTGKILHSQRFSISDFVPDEMVLAPNGKSVAARFKDWLEVIDVKTGHTLLAESVSRTGKESCLQIAYTADGERLIWQVIEERRGYFQSTKLSTEKREQIVTTPMPSAVVRCFACAPDRPTLWVVRDEKLEEYTYDGKRTATHLIPLKDDYYRIRELFVVGTKLMVVTTNRIYTFDRGRRQWMPSSSDSLSITSQFQLMNHNTLVYSFDGWRVDRWNWGNGSYFDQLETLDDMNNYWIRSSEDQKRFAILSSNHITVYDTQTGATVRRIESNSDIRDFSLSGNCVVLQNESGLYLYPHNGRQSRVPIPARDGTQTSFQVFGNNLVVVDTNHQEQKTNLIYHQIDQQKMTRYHVNYHINPRILNTCSDKIVLVIHSDGLTRFDTHTHSISYSVLPFIRPQLNHRSAVATRDGRSILYWSSNEQLIEIVAYETASQRIRHRFRGFHDDGFHHLALDRDGHYFATHTDGHAVQIWDFRGRHAGYPTTLPRHELERFWTQLLDNDAERAFQALRRLAAAPNSTVPFVRDRVAPAVASPKLATLLIDLESPNFAVRDAATRELMRFADVHGPELTKARRTTTSADVRTRLDRILASATYGSSTLVRRERIIELLDWCGTPDATAHLQKLANGHAGAGLTESARSTPANRRP